MSVLGVEIWNIKKIMYILKIKIIYQFKYKKILKLQYNINIGEFCK